MVSECHNIRAPQSQRLSLLRIGQLRRRLVVQVPGSEHGWFPIRARAIDAAVAAVLLVRLRERARRAALVSVVHRIAIARPHITAASVAAIASEALNLG